VADLARRTADLDALVLAGAPVRANGKLYNCAVVLWGGSVLGVVPKRAIPTYNEFYEGRHFTSGPGEVTGIDYAGETDVPFGCHQLFRCSNMSDLVVAVEICEDLWVPRPPSIAAAQAGATLVCNLSASNELVGKASYRRSLVSGQSARLVCAYVYASAGWGESTQDVVFGGHDLVCEDGHVLAESTPFSDGVATSQVDVSLMVSERRRMSSYLAAPTPEAAGFVTHDFTLEQCECRLTRAIDPHPFVPSSAADRDARCEEILAIQAHGLARRLEHTHSSRVVVGVSGGLDSTLAMLVCARAFDLIDLDRSGILAVTMPGFGTTDRTHGNASYLARALGAELREVDITAAVRRHFSDIGHDESVHDVTYENCQARERTQILMDLANQEGGLVIGTGDLSELALGWATYNGDHMSMYGVNASVPKTLVRHLVRHVADTCGDANLSKVLLDVLDTPVSPELLPATADGTISQRTEDLVGPYELHDFLLYEMLRLGFGPAKVYRLACIAFDGSHGADAMDPTEILSWEKVFYRRFFAQQFKRSCLPDGPKVGSVAVSPRGDLRMPSDASVATWQADLDRLG
jgi:NAD+ synthase (glutamine-hydrolysing)